MDLLDRPLSPRASVSLKVRLGVGAALLGAGTVLIALILYLGLGEVGKRLDAALASETRMARYASLSTQAATFLVVSTEAVQTGQTTQTRNQRFAPIVDQLRTTFVQLHEDVARAVAAAENLGLDEQSRYGTQSLGLARMEALLNSTLNGLAASGSQDADRLRAHIDSFASRFDPLLSQAINTEVLFRNTILAGIDQLRSRLSTLAIVIALATLAAVALFYFALIRPQFIRLDRLRRAARQIGQADFAVSLPDTRADEIGQLFNETNRMAAALMAQADAVEVEGARLSETIADRTTALRDANAALEEIDENRRRFFADVSHELRTPLTVILMEAQIGMQADPDPNSPFATIHARATRLNRRVDDLLRLARSDTGQLALDPQPTNLRDLITTVSREIQAEMDNAGMTLELGKMPDLILSCDANWARQVIVSLIRNAMRHARDGALVRLTPEVDATHAGVAICDNGPGILPKDQPRLFDRFAQGNSKTSEQGFGMGLALTAWVVEAQGGTITLTSPLPTPLIADGAPGTKIAVRLPLAKS